MPTGSCKMRASKPQRADPVFKSIFRNLQDFGWLLGLLVLAYVAYRVIPAIDPRSGIDGFGDLFAALVLAAKGVMCAILAWLCKRLYWWEPTDEQDANWHRVIDTDASIGGSSPMAVRRAQWLIIADRLEYAAWLAFWLFVLF